MQKKILAISSPGGHWIQLNKICDGLLQQQAHKIIYVVPSSLFQSKKTKNHYSVVDVSADNKLMLIPCALQILFILLKERPTTIISTGAAPGVLAMIIAKFLPIKTIWVDSIANVKQVSRSGKMIKNHVDIFLTQWKHLEDSNIKYKGAIL